MTTTIASPAGRLAIRLASLILLATICAAAFSAIASAAEIWVVTDSKHPMQPAAGIRLIELDGPARIKAKLSAQLPSKPEQASRVAKLRLEHGGRELQERVRLSHQGVIDAWSLGISKVPAIVVDRRFVIYGETNVARALARIEQYRRRADL